MTDKSDFNVFSDLPTKDKIIVSCILFFLWLACLVVTSLGLILVSYLVGLE
jgi:hypothetical protein